MVDKMGSVRNKMSWEMGWGEVNLNTKISIVLY